VGFYHRLSYVWDPSLQEAKVSAFVDSHPCAKNSQGGAPGKSKVRVRSESEVKSKSKVKGSGQECPLHTSKFELSNGQPLASPRYRPTTLVRRGTTEGLGGTPVIERRLSLMFWSERKRSRAAMFPTLSNSGSSLT
jgi:nitrite reductase/ring-hydroxylating ferredoxin subunit